MGRPIVAHQELWAWLFPGSSIGWLTTKARRVCRNARTALTCMYVCTNVCIICGTRSRYGWMYAIRRYGHGMHAWSKVTPRYVCILPPRSARLCFICSSAACCWCSSVCPLCCWFPVARARVKPLLVIDCRSGALVVARACLSDRCSYSHHHPPLFNRTSTIGSMSVSYTHLTLPTKA